MIPLTRIRNRSKITNALKGKYLRKKINALLLHRIAFENGEIETFTVASKWKTAKKLLLEEANAKCVYCECEIPSNQHGDVEHYRPKSIYWWLAYTIDNYLLSCEVCNQRKSNVFETRNEKVILQTLPDANNETEINSFLDNYAIHPSDVLLDNPFVGLHFLKQKENPKLPNVYIDSVEKLFIWQNDAILQEVEILANENLAEEDKQNAQYTIKLLDLNRVPLKRKRYIEYLKFSTTFRLLKEQNMETTILQILYLNDACEFSGMNNYFHNLLK